MHHVKEFRGKRGTFRTDLRQMSELQISETLSSCFIVEQLSLYILSKGGGTGRHSRDLEV